MSIVREEMSSQQVRPNSATRKKEWLGWIRFIVLLAAVFIIFRFGLSITIISGHSMAPTFQVGNLLLANNMFYKVERNDIIVFKDPHGYNVIKRVIALPNETVAIANGIVSVNGQPIEESFVIGTPNDMPEIVVAKDSYFVMGDNREPGESLDSRSSEVGPIPRDLIKGEYLFSIMPFGIKK